METLLALLQAESRALLSRNVAQLEEATAAKNSHLEKVLQLERAREALFRVMELEGDTRAVLHHLTHRLGDADLGQCWLKLLSLSQECQELNRLNGATIELGYRHLSQALQILCGKPDAPESYGPQGKKDDRSASRLLGQA